MTCFLLSFNTLLSHPSGEESRPDPLSQRYALVPCRLASLEHAKPDTNDPQNRGRSYRDHHASHTKVLSAVTMDR